jgi:hypothetical protein
MTSKGQRRCGLKSRGLARIDGKLPSRFVYLPMASIDTSLSLSFTATRKGTKDVEQKRNSTILEFVQLLIRLLGLIAQT